MSERSQDELVEQIRQILALPVGRNLQSETARNAGGGDFTGNQTALNKFLMIVRTLGNSDDEIALEIRNAFGDTDLNILDEGSAQEMIDRTRNALNQFQARRDQEIIQSMMGPKNHA